MKKIPLFGLVLLLCACSGKKEVKLPPPKVTIAKPLKKDVPIYIQNPGHIRALEEVQIVPQVSGEIMEIFYDEGTFIRAGEMLAKIDDRPYIAILREREAQLKKDEASLKFAIDTLRRNTPLLEDDYISQNAYEDLETNVLKLEAQILEDRAAIDAAEIDVGWCSIAAPISGILGVRKIDVGNIVSQQAESDLVTINNISPVYAQFFIPEKELPLVFQARDESTDPLEVQVSYTNDFSKPFKGKLDFIDNIVMEQTGMIKLRGIFTNNDQKLWPGIFVNTRVILRVEKNAMLIPLESVQVSNKGHFVYIISGDNKVEVKPVEVGPIYGESQLIKKGLSFNDKVVKTGQLGLKAGIKVVVTNKESTSSGR